jgi:hypothetical protein
VSNRPVKYLLLNKTSTGEQNITLSYERLPIIRPSENKQIYKMASLRCCNLFIEQLLSLHKLYGVDWEMTAHIASGGKVQL